MLKFTFHLICVAAAPLGLICVQSLWDWTKPNGEAKHSARRQIQQEQTEIARLISMQGGRVNSGPKFRALLALDLMFWLTDMLMDVACVYSLALSHQIPLAVAQSLVLVVSFTQQLLAGCGATVTAIKESFLLGYRSDKLLQMLQTEKLSEGFWSLLIQSWALCQIVPFHTGLALQLNFSMLLSAVGIVKALYVQVHRDLSGMQWAENGLAAGMDAVVYGRDTE